MPFVRLSHGAVAALAFCAVTTMHPASAQTLDKVTFGTNWVAEAEHGSLSGARRRHLSQARP